MAMKFGTGMAPVDPIRKIAIENAKLAEDLGYDYYGCADQRGGGEHDAYVVLTSAAWHTKRIMIGPMITSPYARIPAMTARAIASLDELTNGRAFWCLGVGGSEGEDFGAQVVSPNQALREATLISRKLWSGETVNFEGKVFKCVDHKLNWERGWNPRPRPNIPIYIATRSPLNLQLAGEVADGAVIASYASKENIKYALELVKKGAEKAGRTLKDVELVSWIYTSIADTREKALENVKPFAVNAMYNTAPEMYEKFGISDKVVEYFLECRKTGARGHRLDMKVIDKIMSYDDLSKFSMAGTPSDCIKKVEELQDLGIGTIWIRPFAAPGSSVNVEQVIRPFGEKVIPKFK
ncbi:MAG: LLM class flavin-dependent oxidoreductase [archaeon]